LVVGGHALKQATIYQVAFVVSGKKITNTYTTAPSFETATYF
jgi:hypothetical protein